jgi:23S rRNA pseudouridine2605 synthase
MDDEQRKPPRKGGHGGPKGAGARPGGKGGKPGFAGKGGKPRPRSEEGRPAFGGKAGKPFRAAPARGGAEGDSARPRGDKPFRKPREEGDAGRAETRGGPRGERKPFKRYDEGKPQGGGNAGPGRRERRDGGDAAKPEGADRPFRAGPRPEGKPFARRRDDGAPEGERPRRFDRDDRPRGDGERPRRFERDERPRGEADRPRRFDKPSGAGPRPDRKPFEKRPAGTAKFGGDRKPFAPSASSGEATGGERPRRFERDDRPRGEPDRPRRFDKPSGTGPRPERKPFDKRPAGTAGSGGDRKPFARTAISAEEAGGERIAKRLARVGIASRRDAEELIAAGRVRVNGKVLESPAFNVSTDDVIELDGKPLPPVERTRLFLFHKPAGVVTTSRDPEGRKTVFDVLPAELPRLITVGRLDINTEGLLLLTNDGGLARTLELPATGWLRRYRVRVHGKVDEKALAELKDGIAVDGVFYGSIEASLDREQGSSNAWLTIGLREGKNREVKNILGALGLDVTRLIRISFGPFQLGELPEGHVQELKGRMLRDQLGERLIEESGANFEADIVRPFSNKPTRRSVDDRPEAAERAAARPLKIGEGGLIKARGRDKDRMREDALGRLSTKPRGGGFGKHGKPESGGFAKPERGAKDAHGERRPKPAFGDRTPRGKGEREQRPIEPPGGRKANVWMAPGARPLSKNHALEEEKSAKRTEGGSAGRKRAPSSSSATSSPASGRTLPTRGRDGRKPRKDD